MSPSEFQDQLDTENEQKSKQADTKAQLNATNKAGIKTVEAVNRNTESTAKGLKNVSGKVAVTNPDLAKTQDVVGVVDAIHKLNLTTFMQNEGLPKLADNVANLSQKTQDLQDQMENQGLKKLADQLTAVVAKLDAVGKLISNTEVSVDSKLQKTIDNLSTSIGKIDFKPVVNVSAPDTKVVTTPIDLAPVTASLDEVRKAIGAIETPEPTDLTPITQGLTDVVNTIGNLKFPVANYVLPFKDINGKATQLQLNGSGALPLTGTIVPVSYDYVGVTYPDGVTEVYAYKTGGSGGTLVATVTMVYTDSTKASISTITRT